MNRKVRRGGAGLTYQGVKLFHIVVARGVVDAGRNGGGDDAGRNARVTYAQLAIDDGESCEGACDEGYARSKSPPSAL